MDSLRHHLGLARAFGLPAALSIGFRRRLSLRKAVEVQWRGTPVLVRPRESDPTVASAVLGWTEYGMGDRAHGALSRLAARWRSEGTTPVIVDGGANVGYAAIYFAQTFPEATVLAIEPNLETFRVLQKNCAGHSNIQMLLGALWSHSNGVSLESSPDRSWADNVCEGGATPSFRLEDIMSSIPNSRPLIIKLDIEGAENEVCRASPEVLREAACLLIEPHDRLNPGSACLSPLYDALHGKHVDTLLVGEYIALVASKLLREAPDQLPRLAVNSPEVAELVKAGSTPDEERGASVLVRT